MNYFVPAFILFIVVGGICVGIALLAYPEILGDESYPSEGWCNSFSNSPDALTMVNPIEAGFCEFNYTDNEWHINKTELRKWQYKEKFGVEP